MASPNAEFQNHLEFLRRVHPTLAVAKAICCEVVVDFVLATAGMREHVLSNKLLSICSLTAAKVASLVSLLKHFLAFVRS